MEMGDMTPHRTSLDPQLEETHWGKHAGALAEQALTSQGPLWGGHSHQAEVITDVHLSGAKSVRRRGSCNCPMKVLPSTLLWCP